MANKCCDRLDGLMSPRFFKALGDPNRVTILARVAESCQAMSVSQIAECCPVNISVVSRHLATLRDAGILHAEKKGKEVFYSLKFQAVSSLLRDIADAIDACCPADPEEATKTKERP